MRIAPVARFFAKVDWKESGCILWTATKNDDGYGRFWYGGRVGMAHKFAYETWRGEIPDGMEIDHICRERSCVNPFHLRVVTHKENMEARRDSQTHCRNGHEFNELNTIWRKDRPGQRNCRQCARDVDKVRDANRTRRRYKEKI